MISRLTLLSVLALAGCDGDPTPTDGGDEGDAGPLPPADGGPDTGFDAGPGPAPLFRNEDEGTDMMVATAALRTMGLAQFGGNPARCVACHSPLNADAIRAWGALSDTAWSTCFSDLAPADRASSAAIIECFRNAGEFDPVNLGIYSTGAYFEWFQWLFRTGAPVETWEEDYQQFQNIVAMPPATHPRLTQGEFDTLTEWFQRGMPLLDELLRPVDPPGTCTPYTSDGVTAVLDASLLDSWSTRNEDAGMLMHGCEAAASPIDCMPSYPRVSTIDGTANWETPAGTTLRIAFSPPYNSSYWTRSSPDGRFVAHGGNNAGATASIIDLERRVVIGADAAYDPGFFPDNSGFVFHGTSRGFSMCETSVLLTDMPTRINFRETGCTGSGAVDLYQHVGASLDGDDYFINNSEWSIDPGGLSRDPEVNASATNEVTFVRMTNTGAGFVDGGTTRVNTPYEANAVISPTGRLLMTQIANGGTNIGYVLHRIDMVREAPGGPITDITLPEIGRYCVLGGKPAFSLDDQWLITHHRAVDADAVDLGFTGPADPGFAAYRGISNVYLVNLRTGVTTRITNMQPGQQALFPHFRSDGWIYILVRTASGERVLASDAALVLGSP